MGSEHSSSSGIEVQNLTCQDPALYSLELKINSHCALQFFLVQTEVSRLPCSVILEGKTKPKTVEQLHHPGRGSGIIKANRLRRAEGGQEE